MALLIGEDYFETLLEEIREIRLSERRFYQKITDIYATAMDYDPIAPTSKQFFSKVQNSVHKHTAAELIIARADAFLKFTHRDILDNTGKVTAEIAKSFAESEFEKYRIVQDRLVESHFDKLLKESEK